MKKSPVRSFGIMHIIQFPVLMLLLSCSMFQTPDPGIRGLLPRETDVPGWERIADSVRVETVPFTGARESYSYYNVREKSSASYRSYGSGDQITAEIVRCDSVLDAFGIFSWERNSADDFRRINDTAMMNRASLIMCDGLYFIRLESAVGENDPREAFQAFTGSIRQNLDLVRGTETLPSYMVLFSPDYSWDTLLFLRKGHSDLPGVTDLFIRKRSIFDREIHVFFHLAQNEERSDYIFKNLASRANKFMLARSGDYPLAFRETEPGRMVFVSRYGPWVFGILNGATVDEGTKITGMLYREIRDFR